MTTTNESTGFTRPASELAAGPGRRRWAMLALLLAGQFMALLDVTIVNVAMPTIGRSLHGSGAELQLVVAGYTVSYAMLLITGARLGDLRGRRTLFLLGVAVFTLASALCGFAPTITVLIVARFVQGAGAAATMPQIMSVIQARFTGRDRARALSAYSAVIASGFVAGQVFGGLLVNADLFGSQWRPVFLVNLPIGLAVLALAPRFIPRDEVRAGSGSRRRVDLAGLAFAVPAVFAIVLPLTLGHQEHWPWWVPASIAAGLVLAAAFVAVERRIAARGGDPLLNLRVLAAPGLASGLTAMVLLMASYGGFLFAVALQLQTGLGESALRAGLTFAPSALVFGLVGFFWNRLPVRLHHLLTPLGCGAAVLAYILLGLDLASGGRGGALLVVILVLLGGSLAAGFSPLVTHSLMQVPVAEAADASGLLTTTLQLGQAVGVATFGSVFLSLAAHPSAGASGHAVAVTMYWVAAVLAVGAVASVPLTLTVRRTRRSASA
ncbi:MAG TPA: MFS transporter [Streptosporangiaceae bacterium]|nr:MFS transporter [Streptosporangiaceae bacterium]